jgi:hypothetical protein
MIKKLLLPLLIFICSYCNAETIKTDVLVIGGGACGVAAAIQSARSKVKTLLVEPGAWLGGDMTMGGMCVLDANRDLPSGIWGEFRRKVTEYYHTRLGYDTTKTAILRFEPYTGAEILKKITDTVKNLSVKLKTPWTSIKKDGTGWDVEIKVNGELVKVEAKVVVDGTETGEVAAKAGTKFADEEAKETINWVAILKDFGKNTNKTIAKPEGYDPSAYSYLKNKDIRQWLRSREIPNDKYMIAPESAVSGNDHGELLKTARLRTLGLVYYLQTELGYKNLGLDDQFGTADHLAPEPLILTAKPVKGDVRMVYDDITKPYDRESKLYRTSIAVGNGMDMPAFSIPLAAVLPKDADNLLVTEKALSVTHDVAEHIGPAIQMTLGQGVGAMAAFCAFFKTTTKHLNVRIIQGEILDFKGYLLPLTDISQKDPHWRAIQQVCETGLLKGIQKANGHMVEIHFEPNDVVTTAEVKPVLDEIYSRAFIWFNKEKPGEKLTLGNVLYFISDYTLTDPDNIKNTIRENWKTKFKLPGEFDVHRPITRLEFAVLVNRYLNPFAKTVNLTGRIVN